VRVVIAEDNALLRDGLELLLTHSGHEVAAAVDNAPSLLAALDADLPDIVVVDVRLPPSFQDEGLRAAVEARRRHPGLPILVLSQYVERAYATELLTDRAGAIGYLLKDRVARVDEFLDALNRVAAGGTALDPEVVSQLLARDHGRPLHTLTAREREVLELMAQGHDNATIAELLFVTERSVGKHIGSIFTKLGLLPTDPGHRRVLAVLTLLGDQ
jgi:DNA-binding NarL/FixJ family response regulator